MEISKDAKKIIDSAGSGALDYINNQGNFGGRLTSGEATRLLSGFTPSITPQQVYSAANISQANNSPIAPPNYSDPFALREYFMNSGDLMSARNAVTEANKALIAARQTGRIQQQAIQNLPQALNVIRGEQAVSGQNQALVEQALAENLLAAQSGYDVLSREASARYDIAQREREKIQSLISATGGKAGISYADSFDVASRKASDYERKVNENAQKKKYKESLKEQLLSLGLKTKGSTKELETRLSKSIKNKKDREKLFDDLKLQAAKIDIAKGYKSLNDSGEDYTQSEIKAANETFIFNSLSSAEKGRDGFVDPSVWRAALNDWTEKGGGTPSEFFAKFLGKVDKKGKRKSGFINPKDI